MTSVFAHMRLYLKACISLLLLLPFSLSWGQQAVLQVVTKKVEKSFSYKPGYEVNIEGEKADVSIQTWDKNEIKVELELIAKHKDQSVALKDIENLKYLAKRVKNKVYLRNYVSSEEGTPKPLAALTARYLITLPEECPVYLKNHFGEANISNLTNSLRVNSEFSSIGLDNIQGTVDVQSRFGDIIGDLIDGQVRINSRRSDVLLTNISGSYDITSHYGVIRIFAEDELLKLNLDATHSDVYFINPNPAFYSYNLEANQGDISVPDDLKLALLEDQPSLKRYRFKPPSREYFATITLTVTFGNINLEKGDKVPKP